MAGDTETSVERIMEEIRLRADARKLLRETTDLLKAVQESSAQQTRLSLYGLERLNRNLAASNLYRDALRSVSGESEGLKKKLKQFTRKAIFRLFRWYLWPLQEFHQAIAESLNETASALENLQTNLVALAGELDAVKENREHDLRITARSAKSASLTGSDQATILADADSAAKLPVDER